MHILAAILVGAFLGLIGSRVLFVGSALSLIPWGLVGLANGLYSRSKKQAVVNGVIYGFVLSFIFMVSGYSGSRPLIAVIPFFVLLGLFGALCGAVLGLIGFFLKKIFKK